MTDEAQGRGASGHRRMRVEHLLPRNQYLVTGSVAVSALRDGRWVEGELGLTEEWLVFASADPHDAPDFVLLERDLDVDASTSVGIAIVTITIAGRPYRYRAHAETIAALIAALTRLRDRPPTGTRVWRRDTE